MSSLLNMFRAPSSSRVSVPARLALAVVALWAADGVATYVGYFLLKLIWPVLLVATAVLVVALLALWLESRLSGRLPESVWHIVHIIAWVAGFVLVGLLAVHFVAHVVLAIMALIFWVGLMLCAVAVPVSLGVWWRKHR